MGLSYEMNNYLQELGFDPDKKYDTPSSLEEASIRSIESFIGSALPDKPKQSGGRFPITGPSVIRNTKNSDLFT